MPGGNIFLNYRRDDTAGHAGRLFDRLNHRFPGRIFRDVTGIAYGADFVEEIERKLASCHVLIVLIGKYWLTLTDEDGRRRLYNEQDFVRLEVATGLRRNIRVIPVLVGGARMPRARELPEDLKPLAKRNALEITEPDFDNDAARLIQALQEALGETPRWVEPAWRTLPKRKRSHVGLFVGLGAVILVAVVVAILALTQTSATPAPTAEVKDTPALVKGGSLEESFDPVGSWIVTGLGSDLNGTLFLDEDGSFYAKGTFRREYNTLDGTWRYGSNPLILIFTVEFSDGTPATHILQIKGQDAGGYFGIHSFYGNFYLRRAASR